MKKFLKIIMYIITIFILLINIVLIIKSIAYPRDVASIMGYEGYVVSNGSVQTNLKKYDFVFVKKCDDYKKDDIVIVKKDGKISTSYSVKNEMNGMLELENDTKDSIKLSSSSVQGKVTLKSSLLGQIVILMRNPIIETLVISVMLMLSVMIFKFVM